MTENKRIFLNIVASYGRSLFALACGLFSSRWLLMSLGTVDFGLFGLIGGMVVFISFFNGLLSSAVGRFYAFSVGKAKSAGGEEGLEECRQWFNTALLLHTVVPLVLIVVGYPIGVYAIEHWLVIPPERLAASIWVFRFVCISCFVGMVNVPFNAMYTAKQYIAELTIYSVISTALNVSFLYYMVSTPQDWLVKYAAWTCVLSITPQVIISLRALKIFPECKIRFDYCWNWSRVKQLSNFAGWQAFGNLGGMLRSQGIAILINRRFGPAMNTPMTVANSISSHSDTLSAAMIGAFAPAITNACGAQDYKRMRMLAYQTCKVGTLLTLLFALPLALELPEVLRLWLKNPPPYTVGLAWSILVMMVIDRTAVGHMLAVAANGKIARYQAVLGTFIILSLPVAWLFVRLGWGIYSVGWAMALMTACCAWGRVYFARYLVNMSAMHWLKAILLPLACVIAVALGVGAIPVCLLPPSIYRVILTGCVTDLTMLAVSWVILLNREERAYVIMRIVQLKEKFIHA